MLDPREFQVHGERLAEGKRTRVDHSCGAGRTLLVSRNAEGIAAYCFRCSEKGFIGNRLSLVERIAKLGKLGAADSAAGVEVLLPAPGVLDPTEWPTWAKLWLYKAGFSSDMIRAQGWYYHPGMERVILPIKQDGEVVFWQGRGNNPQLPKYHAPTVDRGKLVGKYGTGPILVLTEDILSAAKIGYVTEAWTIMGTSINDYLLDMIVQQGKPVVVALDPDAAGRRGGNKIRNKLQLCGVPVASAYMDTDPKLQPIERIRSWLHSIQSAQCWKLPVDLC